MKKLLLAVVLPLAATSVYAETSVTLYPVFNTRMIKRRP